MPGTLAAAIVANVVADSVAPVVDSAGSLSVSCDLLPRFCH